MARVADAVMPPRIAFEGPAWVSLRTLMLIRWIAIIGQAGGLLFVHFGLGFALPLELCLAVVGASAVFNIAHGVSKRARLGDLDAAAYLGFDLVQLTALLYLTGGLQNPFAILILAPVTVAATILSRRSVVGLCILAVLAISLLAVAHEPLPWKGPSPEFPYPYVLGVWVALVLSTLFIAVYAWNVAGGARRMGDAFAETQLALAREQRVSAVGALAAAAAHELGSPLGTIAVIAKELLRELPPDSPFLDDAKLLVSQTERCRTILAELAHRPDTDGGSPFTKLPISALVEAAGAPYRRENVRVIYATAQATRGDEPVIARSPEIMHGLGNLISNAIQFAEEEVTVTVSWDAETIGVDIADDGIGFPADVLARLGEPYISGRTDRSGHMGLGIFIAQTLLERSGASLSFANLPEGGAHVVIQWRRGKLEAVEGT